MKNMHLCDNLRKKILKNIFKGIFELIKKNVMNFKIPKFKIVNKLN
jgi:hypothetical protein